MSLTRAWVDDPRELVDVLVLSPLSVRPDRQHRGVGRALAARPLGFTAPSVRIRDRAFQAWLTPAYRPDLSGALVYPDVFWRHDAVGLRT